MTAQAQSTQQLEQLAEQPLWKGLLHVHASGPLQRHLNTKPKSQVDDPAFFMDKLGAKDYVAELKTAVRIFSNPQHPEWQARACQFPARYHWLKNALPNRLPTAPVCKKFEKFASTIDAQDVFLIFPVAYLNSPSSMFGHTFLRLKAEHRDNPLLDYSINFAANADDSTNILLYSIQGLTGGYPGVYSVVPYYEKIKEYSALDSRDIWEYKLNLSQPQVDQLVRHTYELQSIEFDYYFFRENCSYRLMTLLAAVSEPIAKKLTFDFRAVPADTIRFLANTPGLGEVIYRPSQVTELRTNEKQSLPENIDLAKRAVLEPDFDLEQISNHHNASEILELAYQYSRFLAAKEKRPLTHLSRRSIQLLSLRSKIKIPSKFKPPVPNSVRDDQGHGTLGLTTSSRLDDGVHTSRFALRGAYHDLLDSSLGYPEGAQLEIMQLEFEHDWQKSNTQFQKLAMVEIRSQTPMTELIKPASWSVGFGFERSDFNDRVGGYIHGSRGRTFALDQDHTSFNIAIGGQALVFDDQTFLDVGPTASLLYQGAEYSAQLAAKIEASIVDPDYDTHFSSTLTLARHFKNFQLRATVSHERFSNASPFGPEALDIVELGFRYYVDAYGPERFRFFK